MFDAVQDRCKEALVLKLSSIRSAVSIELRLVADSQTQTQGYSWYPRQHSVARVKNVVAVVSMRKRPRPVSRYQ